VAYSEFVVGIGATVQVPFPSGLTGLDLDFEGSLEHLLHDLNNEILVL